MTEQLAFGYCAAPLIVAKTTKITRKKVLLNPRIKHPVETTRQESCLGLVQAI